MIITTQELPEFCKINNSIYDVNSTEEAYSFVKYITRKHYENFAVGSLLIPSSIAKYFFSIYAFARVADNIADELTLVTSRNEANKYLTQFENNLISLFDSNIVLEIKNPIFLALKDTIISNNLTIDPFSRLITAFRSDIFFKTPADFNELFDYCHNSANPVGELILSLFKENTPQAIHFSNSICTALQLINFWQDLSIDLRRNRCYIPQNLINHQTDPEFYYNYFVTIDSDRLKNILDVCYSITAEKLEDGKKIIQNINDFRLK